MSPDRPVAQRRAVLIGINHFRNAPDLRGCVNDVKLMSSVLQRVMGFAPDDLRELYDEGATRREILRALDEVRREAGESTSIFLYYSGRSIRLPTGADAEATGIIKDWGPEGEAPGVGYETALLPSDWGPSGEAPIRYGELRAWLSELEARRPVVVFDVCYAGGLLDDAPRKRVLFFGASPPEGIGYETELADGVAHGAFTYSLAQALLRATPETTFRRAFRHAAAETTSRFPHQRPVLEGDEDRRVLDVDVSQVRRDVLVVDVSEDIVTLDAGAVEGLTAESLWAAYPAGTQNVTPKAEKLGVLEITEVRASDASARIVSEVTAPAAAPGEQGGRAIGPGARVVEEVHNYGDMRLRVALKAPPGYEGHLESFVASLTPVQLVRVISSDGPADVTVRLVAPGEPSPACDGGGPAASDEPMWAIEDRKSRPLTRPRPVSSKSVYSLRQDLEKLARYQNVLALTNPNLKSALAGQVELMLHRRDPGGAWVKADAEPGRGIAVLHAGEEVQLEVRNHWDRAIYANLMDFGLMMSLSIITRFEPTGVRVGPGDRFEFVSRLHVPSDFEGEAGVETVKLFATACPADLGSLLFQNSRGGRASIREGSSDELGQLMAIALTGKMSRECRPVHLPPEQEWTTKEFTFELRRGGR